MPKPHGLDHFVSYFKEHEDNYVIIGGSAAAILLEDVKLEFRATGDIDVVIFTNSSGDLNAKICQYIKAGDYQTRESTDDSPKYYRFSRPSDEKFPKILELFARNEAELDLSDDQYIIPIQNIEEVRLSAILLDDEYFELVKSGATKSTKGYPIINASINICLKARAFRDLFKRNRNNDIHIDSKDIKKHLKDIFKLVPALTNESNLALTGLPKSDVQFALEELTKLDNKTVKQFMKGYPIVEKNELLDSVRKTFNLV